MTSIKDWTPVDPYKSTRRVFTNNLVCVSIPTDANSDWAHLARSHQELLKALFDHPAMEPNREQTYMTPANKKTKVYFLWDFVGRTLGLLYLNVPPDVPARIRNEEDGIWQDVLGRAVNAELLITEPNNPFATMLMSINIDEPADFGPEVTRLAKNITEKPGQLYTREGLRELYKDAPDSLVRGATNLMR